MNAEQWDKYRETIYEANLVKLNEKSLDESKTIIFENTNRRITQSAQIIRGANSTFGLSGALEALIYLVDWNSSDPKSFIYQLSRELKE